jgi:acid phosphatase family membrane protein YuiD
MISLLTVIGLQLGLQSVEFAIVAVLTVIVLYDAVNVRRAVGEHGLVISRLLQTKKQKDAFYTAKGHTIIEVAVGSLIGFMVAIMMLRFL